MTGAISSDEHKEANGKIELTRIMKRILDETLGLLAIWFMREK